MTGTGLATVSAAVWHALVGLPLAPGSPDGAGGPPCTTVGGSVRITGAWEGTVGVACSEPLAHRIAVAMHGVPSGLGTDDVDDALAELANVVAGAVRPALPAPCTMALPTVDRPVPPAAASAETVTFHSDGEPVTVSLSPAPPAAPADHPTAAPHPDRGVETR